MRRPSLYEKFKLPVRNVCCFYCDATYCDIIHQATVHHIPEINHSIYFICCFVVLSFHDDISIIEITLQSDPRLKATPNLYHLMIAAPE